MGSRYKGQTCVYCAMVASSEAPDHIFARGFFPVEERGNLPMVPACRTCNQEKAAFEHYLLTVLPFGGETPSSTKVLNNAVPRRLAGNLKLHKELAAHQVPVWVERGNLTLPSFTLPIDVDKLIGLFKLITRALVTHHWNLIIPRSHIARAGMFTAAGERFMKELFQKRSANHARGRLGADTILYEGVQAVDDPYLTIWRYRLYGGIMMAGDPTSTREITKDIWATTGSPTTADMFDLD